MKADQWFGRVVSDTFLFDFVIAYFPDCVSGVIYSIVQCQLATGGIDSTQNCDYTRIDLWSIGVRILESGKTVFQIKI